MSRGRTGRGYEQVGIDFAPGKDGVEVALPFNRHHLLIGRVPLKQPEQAAYTFLKFENYGTEGFSNILKHGVQFGLHIVRRDREERLASRRETAGKTIMGRFQELAQCIFELPSPRPTPAPRPPAPPRAPPPGAPPPPGGVGVVRCSVQVVKMSMVKLNSFLINPNSSRFLEWA